MPLTGPWLSRTRHTQQEPTTPTPDTNQCEEVDERRTRKKESSEESVTYKKMVQPLEQRPRADFFWGSGSRHTKRAGLLGLDSLYGQREAMGRRKRGRTRKSLLVVMTILDE